jgi:hypothetical protein
MATQLNSVGQCYSSGDNIVHTAPGGRMEPWSCCGAVKLSECRRGSTSRRELIHRVFVVFGLSGLINLGDDEWQAWLFLALVSSRWVLLVTLLGIQTAVYWPVVGSAVKRTSNEQCCF